ncbi:MAG TPA: tetratricopeptide repeat protein [Caulobacteraceae bacterium]|nr:tetratricopeptide repeat protein [Caulobacteraceae bacterium]
MAESDPSFGRRSRATPLLVGAAIGVLALAGLTLASCGDYGAADRPGGGFGFGRKAEARYACPRPQGISGVQPGFNDQEREIRHLRRLAFANDFFAQLELGRRYQASRAVDKNIEDPIESAVWYAMALANGDGYAPINRAVRRGFNGWRPLSRYDDCRAWERENAYATLERQLARMSTQERDEVRNRIIYVLSTMDAEGYRTLARLYDDLYGPFGEPADNAQALRASGLLREKDGRRGPRSVTNLFPRNDVDAYLYNYLAVQTGDVSAYVLLKDFERSTPQRANYGAFVEAKAKRWVPPFEFYPPDAPQGGVPHSDQSRARGDAYEYALQRIHELPFQHVSDALLYLGVIQRPTNSGENLAQGEIDTLKAMLGHAQGGRMTNLEKVRAVQYAAVNGSSKAQLVLAVMYAEGVGVPADYARAFHWFEEADKQGSPEAKFAMSTYFALGIEGVADQDKAKAVVYRIESALAGFKPTISRIQAVLNQVSRGGRPSYRDRRRYGPDRSYDEGRR